MKQNKFKLIINQYFAKLKDLHPTIRQIIGILLIIMGFFGFLPIIGFWMIPLGLMLLAIDFPWAKRILTRLKYQYRKLIRHLKNNPSSKL